MREGLFGGGLDFLQLRASYAVSGRAGDRAINFTAPGSAETFQGRGNRRGRFKVKVQGARFRFKVPGSRFGFRFKLGTLNLNLEP